VLTWQHALEQKETASIVAARATLSAWSNIDLAHVNDIVPRLCAGHAGAKFAWE
jgi:hypothetical protein